MAQCPICKEQATSSPIGTRDVYVVTCPRCGVYQITYQAQVNLGTTHLTQRQVGNISSWLYENQKYEITTHNLDALTIIKTPSFHERSDKLLLRIESQTEFAGQFVPKELSWISCAWCANEEELQEILKYLKTEQRIHTDFMTDFKILPAGWARLEELRKINANSEQCFVAMWFHESMNTIYDDAIAKAIYDAGLDHRVEMREHNEKEMMTKSLPSEIRL